MQTAEWLGGRREAFGSLAPCENLTTASDHVKYSYTLCSLRLLMCLFSPPHHHHRHPAPTLTEKICVHSCRPARWSESDWRGGRVKTQAGVPFCWPESGSSHVLLQHSQQHHTVRQKVKGRQVISHTHTQHFAAEKKTHLFSPSPSSSASLLTSTPFTDSSAKPTCVHSRANDVKVNGPLIPPETTTKETWSDSGAFE